MTYPAWVHAKLARFFDTLAARIAKKYDVVLIITGPEGAGKSRLAMWILSILDPSFGLDRIAWDSDAFIELAADLRPAQGRLLDESDEGGFSRDAMGGGNKRLVKHLFRCRAFYLFNVLIMPGLAWFDPVIAKHRAAYWILITDRGKAVLHKFRRADYPGAKPSWEKLFGFDYPDYEAPWIPQYEKDKKSRALHGGAQEKKEEGWPDLQDQKLATVYQRLIPEEIKADG